MFGMAASLASLVRGQDVIADAEALKTIAAEQLDISPYAFNQVVDTLERTGMVDNVLRKGSHIVTFTENVPFHQDLYKSLGGEWQNGQPSQLEEEMVAVVDRLATGPVPTEQLEDELGLDRSDIPHLLEVGKASELVQEIVVIEGPVLYSPFFGFENPQVLGRSLLCEHLGTVAPEPITRSYRGSSAHC